MRVLFLVIIFFSKLLFPQPYSEAVEKWSIPEKVVENAVYPHITRDGKKLFFLNPDGYHYIEKLDSGWSEPVRLGDNVNNFYLLSRMFLSPDQKTMYLTATENWWIFRLHWDEGLNDWGPPELLTDNGINTGEGAWFVSSFLNDTTIIFQYSGESYISYYDSTTNLWSAPQSWPCEWCRMYAMFSFWITPDGKKAYQSNESFNLNRGQDIFVSFYMGPNFSYGYSLNFCIYMDSLYDAGVIKGNNEVYPSFTDDGRTMYFVANYDSLTRRDIHVTRMIVDENGDTILSSTEKDISDIKDESIYLYPGYPNPFNSTTTIKYILSNSSDVTIRLYNPLGTEIKSIPVGRQSKGIHNKRIDLSNLASGVYILGLDTGTSKKYQKITLLK